jgi:hypothetical protein
MDPLNSILYEWHSVPGEHFTYRKGDTVNDYDVNKAKRIVRDSPRAIEFVSISSLKDDSEETKIQKTKDKDVKLHIPIIMATMPSGEQMCIDGYHRIRKAIRINENGEHKISKLPAVILSKKETEEILKVKNVTTKEANRRPY